MHPTQPVQFKTQTSFMGTPTFEDPGHGIKQYDQLKKYSGFHGKLMNFFGMAEHIRDESGHQDFYVKKRDLMRALIGDELKISSKKRNRIHRRILEIIDPDSRIPASETGLKKLFAAYYKKNQDHHIKTANDVIHELEQLKQDESITDIPQITYKDSLKEIVGHLKPGDIFARKYHEDNPNPICVLQRIFHSEGYRESYKCSHIATYLGEIDGEFWIAEASTPHGTEPQIRRLRIDDPRFASKIKNQYFVFRNRDEKIGKEAAKFAKEYARLMKMPNEEKTERDLENEDPFNYTFFEGIRSMYHSPTLGMYGRHRALKYYADYVNNVDFHYITGKRRFFCSHFSMTAEAFGEMSRSEDFQEFIKLHPPPKGFDSNKKGIALLADKLIYSLKKGVWSRWNAMVHAKEIGDCFQTKLDFLRTSPQNVVQYLLDDKEHYEIVGIVSHEGDLEKEVEPIKV